MALAIFDLDNTLIAGDSDHSWGEFLVSEQLVDAQQFKKTNDQFYADYVAGSLDIFAYLEFSLQPLTKMSMTELAELHKRFMQQVIAPMQLAKAQALLQQHRDAGDRLLIITSTNRFIVEPICHSLGVTEILATDAQIVDGRYSGKVEGVPTYKEGKVVRLNAWLKEQGESLKGSWFYSDSINDLPLLLEVDRAVAVDPCPALQAVAEEKHWQIISLRD
ncbi:HAD-IB family hydrolase [Porticoccaceae bacterium]|nr:HAD-IB family hydrolase [Porticoccaceae bacterium]MDB9804613.1 HAD-IB family hydrolase [Porticoccaceae bacterium]MDB9949654.1 HAD-IB family hydrolase [Porticoccaceae bacterium]